MNMQAAFKTLMVVLAIGAITGWSEWRQVNGGTPEERAQRDIAKCVRERESADYQTHMFSMGREAAEQKKRIKVECDALVRGGGLVLGAPAKSAAPANGTPAQATRTSKPHPSSDEPQGRRERCLARIEEARSRSPGGLNPEWEQDQRNRCEAQ
jgi:hypothetical protein